MNDLHDELHDAVTPSSPPPIDDLWRRGRAAGRRRVFGLAALVVAVVGLGGLVITITDDDSGPVDTVGQPDGIVEGDPPVIDVPAGTLLTLYPVGLEEQGWEIDVQPVQPGIDPEHDLVTLRADDGRFAVLDWVESGRSGPLEFDVPAESDPALGGPSGWDAATTTWEGDGATGSAVVLGGSAADLRELVALLVENRLLQDPSVSVPGWSVIQDWRRVIGGAVVTATSPDNTIVSLYDQHADGEPFEPVGPFDAPGPDGDPFVLPSGATAYQLASDQIAWADGAVLRTLTWSDNNDSARDAFLAALVPVVGREVDGDGASTDATMLPGRGPTLEDHWHAAYGVYACGEFLPAFTDETDPEGIHTHADGLIHIHPFVQAAAGPAATFERFLDSIGLSLTDGSAFGDTGCEGPTEDVLVRWSPGDSSEPADVWEAGEGTEASFQEDRELWVLARMPSGWTVGDVPLPPADRLEQLAQATDVGTYEQLGSEMPGYAAPDLPEHLEPIADELDELDGVVLLPYELPPSLEAEEIIVSLVGAGDDTGVALASSGGDGEWSLEITPYRPDETGRSAGVEVDVGPDGVVDSIDSLCNIEAPPDGPYRVGEWHWEDPATGRPLRAILRWNRYECDDPPFPESTIAALIAGLVPVGDLASDE